MSDITKDQINAAALELYGVSATYDPAQVERALAAAASLRTPPADDVREALAQIIDVVDGGTQPGQNERWENIFPLERDQIVDAILARLDVRQRGAVAPEHVEAVARRFSPHLWNGSFERGLASISLFTPEQAAASAEKKRQEKLAVVRRVLEASVEVGA